MDPLNRQQIDELVEAIQPLVARYPSPIRGVALAECMVRWLSDHNALGDPDVMRKLRSDLRDALNIIAETYSLHASKTPGFPPLIH